MGRAAHVAPAARRESLLRAFQTRYGRVPAVVAEAPGRVNLIGEHLDYNGGLVLPCAIDRSVLAAAAPRDDLEVRLHSVDFDEASAFSLDAPIARDDDHLWSNYLRGAVDVLRQNGHDGPGLDIAIMGDVPAGAGLSSSAALEVATIGAVCAAWSLDLDGRRIALLAQRAENEFVGVQCGVMDQFAAAMGVAGHALLVDCRTLAVEPVPLRLDEQALALVIVNSAVPRRLEASAYNRRREECVAALQLLQGAMGERAPAALCDVTPEDFDAFGGALPPLLHRRARHVVTEMARVRGAVVALRADDFARFGALMYASHESLRDDFEVSCSELDRLVELASAQQGVLGTRLTGAGFGGCTVNLVRGDAIDSFAGAVGRRYAEETGLAAELHICQPADGLRVTG